MPKKGKKRTTPHKQPADSDAATQDSLSGAKRKPEGGDADHRDSPESSTGNTRVRGKKTSEAHENTPSEVVFFRLVIKAYDEAFEKLSIKSLTETYEATQSAYNAAKSACDLEHMVLRSLEASAVNKDELKKQEKAKKDAQNALEKAEKIDLEAKEALHKAKIKIAYKKTKYRTAVTGRIKVLEERPCDDPTGSEVADLRKRMNELATYKPEKRIRELDTQKEKKEAASLILDFNHPWAKGKTPRTNDQVRLHDQIRAIKLLRECTTTELTARNTLVELKVQRESFMRQHKIKPENITNMMPEVKRELNSIEEKILNAGTKYEEAIHGREAVNA